MGFEPTRLLNVTLRLSKTLHSSALPTFRFNLAVDEGFEPSEPFIMTQPLSREPLSTAQPLYHIWGVMWDSNPRLLGSQPRALAAKLTTP